MRHNITIPEFEAAFTIIDSKGTLLAKDIKCAERLHSCKKYRYVRLRGYAIMSHHVVYILTHKVIPTKLIDHINGDGLDNSPDNLREATPTQNMQNRKIGKDNTSGRKGVMWSKTRNKWRARININKRKVHLGFFDSLDEAGTAYDTAAIKHFGQFANINKEYANEIPSRQSIST